MKIDKKDQLIQLHWKKHLGREMTSQELEQWRLWREGQEECGHWEKMLEQLRRYGRIEQEKEGAEAQLEAAFEARYGRPMQKTMEIEREYRIGFTWLKVAASIVGLCLIGVLFFYKTKPVDSQAKKMPPLRQIEIPGGDTVVLVLTDGTRRTIRRQQMGMVVREQNVMVSMQKGQLIYSMEDEKEVDQEIFHTIIVPPGGQLKVRLPDNSIASLSAASRLRFPLNMTASRSVEMTGEVFFNITEQEKPFIVKAGSVETMAVGTHFGVDMHSDNGVQLIALFEGKISITNGISKTRVEVPQITRVCGDGITLYSREARDLKTIAFREKGVFNYENAYLSTILSDVARWYGLRIVNPENMMLSEHFDLVSIERSEPVEKILRVLERSRLVRFELKEHELTVTQL